ncbi:MAG: triose-phosphate isomerase [Dehalococcoidia bacterium]|nr:MAG: triose-phosphate isomerase [Dehalococcoidia bacterium]UCG83841.1 MAG: triose-phosphate isomerase [Dehalococcoidia bacterium]
MRKPIIAGNWKMNTSTSEATELVKAMKKKLVSITGVDKVLCPPFVSLSLVKDLIKGTSIKLGAQNMHYERSGAYTGEISPVMLSGLCSFVILGHSERRALFEESDQIVNKKVQAALDLQLTPIVCVGESLEQNEAGETIDVVTRQIKAAFNGVESLQGTVVAYEPIWAIGTGKAARGDQANAIHKVIRSVIAQLYDDSVAQDMRIQYGGSVTAANIAEFIGQPEIDGALVGGASLKAPEFISIVEQTSKIKKTG